MTKTGSERKTAFVRVLLFILAALLIFGGPTYAVYVLRHLAGLPYILVVLVGLIAFAVGILLFLRLIRLIRKQTKLGASE
jgi:cytochrome c biogenesis protein CcdA